MRRRIRIGDDLGSVTLREALESYRVDELKQMAGLVMQKAPTRHGELVAAIMAAMSGDALGAVWARLNEIEQAAVAEAVCEPGGYLSHARFIAKYRQAPWANTPEHPYDSARKGALSPLSLFLYRGAWIPRDLRARLKAFVPEPPPVEIITLEDLPETVVLRRPDRGRRPGREHGDAVRLARQETAAPALHDIHAVLRLVSTGRVRVSEASRQVTTAGARAILDILHSGDFYPSQNVEAATDTIRPFAWPLILQAAGLVSVSGGRLRLTKAGAKALATPPHHVIYAAWRRWLDTTLIDEFNRIDVIKGQHGKARRGLTAMTARRQMIVDALGDCPPGRWISVDEFFRFMRATGHDLQVARNLWDLYVVDPHYGSLGQGDSTWEIVEGRYAMVFLWEYAATMGLLDVAYIPPEGAREDYAQMWGVDSLACFTRYDGLEYIRITPLGAWCLGIAEEYVPVPPDVRATLTVLPTLEVVVADPHALPPGDVLFLERFAERVADVTWRLTTGGVLAAVEDGVSVAEMEAFLATRSVVPLPETVTVLFGDARERTGKLRDRGPARLIEAADAALARLITSDRRLARFCHLAGERTIVVPAGSDAGFRRALRDLGYSIAPQAADTDD